MLGFNVVDDSVFVLVAEVCYEVFGLGVLEF